MWFTSFLCLVNEFRSFGIITYDNMILYFYFHKFRIFSYSLGVAISLKVKANSTSSILPCSSGNTDLLITSYNPMWILQTSCFYLFKALFFLGRPSPISFRCLLPPHYFRLSLHILNAQISVLSIKRLWYKHHFLVSMYFQGQYSSRHGMNTK